MVNIFQINFTKVTSDDLYPKINMSIKFYSIILIKAGGFHNSSYLDQLHIAQPARGRSASNLIIMLIFHLGRSLRRVTKAYTVYK